MSRVTSRVICRAFGNEQRVGLLLCLANPHSVTELERKCTLSQSALSQHLKILKRAGLVVSTRQGKNMVYKVKSKKVIDLAKMLLQLKKE